MEDKILTEKESLELISRMIQNTKMKMAKNSGVPFLIWGYVTIATSFIVWYMLTATDNYRWNYLWFLIPLIGGVLFLFYMKNKQKEVHARTFVDRTITNIWLVLGISAFVISLFSMFVYSIPILFLMILLMGIGTTLTGLTIGFKFLMICGLIGIIMSFSCLFIKNTDQILIFAAVFLIMMVVPGHVLNYVAAKEIK